MGQQGIPVIYEGKFSTRRVNLDSYFLFVEEDIFLSVEYGIKDESNDLPKNIILNSMSKYNSMNVKYLETSKEMLDKLENLHLGGKFQFSDLEKNGNDSIFIAVTIISSSQEEDDGTSDNSEKSSINLEEKK